MELREIPELRQLEVKSSLIRLPMEQDVPLTPRIRSLLDSAPFQRLRKISQLGFVSYVYPGATHSRFEHSLGVYRLSLHYLRQLLHFSSFTRQVSVHGAQKLIVAALLHDLGHWPFCHPTEDMALSGIPTHEHFSNHFLFKGEIADQLRSQWQIEPQEIVDLLTVKAEKAEDRLLQSILSGPIDIDKMDYLQRDSQLAGVPYGCHFDWQRLIGSLCLDQNEGALAITSKGRTAAEMMVFARYVMFNEVYWHHAVRSATAMYQRAFYLLHEQLDFKKLFSLTEAPFIEVLQETAQQGAEKEGGQQSAPYVAAAMLLDGLFGPKRGLYKRLLQFNSLENEPLFTQLAHKPYSWLARCSEAFAKLLSQRTSRPVSPHEILLDAPPIHLEVQCNIEIYFSHENAYRPLQEVSPVVTTLARRQFDDYVKRVRLFIHPRWAKEFNDPAPLLEILEKAVKLVES
ncbi:MAG: HD domain-containing protein [Pirellulaceae bacterium]|nr:HD domain-containing protein [Pirellulaceae bacterium]